MCTSRFLQGMLLGVALTVSAWMLVDAAGAAAGPARVATQNGDVNGDSNIDLSDAVSLLLFLFQGGPAPAPIECEEPEPMAPQVRFLNDLTCDGARVSARLDVCDGTAISRQTSDAFETCQTIEANDTCFVKVSGSAACGSFAYCAEIPVEPGKVYDFVLAFDGAGPMILLFVNPLLTEGSCPAFPLPGTPPTLRLTAAGCDGAGGGAALESGPWAAAGKW